ncbi:MAG: glycosyltransferase family 2 protein [Solirubrobacteraceae bacterium]|nr:glycosyltransferase family 2 protein [Patulibacter sp.]
MRDLVVAILDRARHRVGTQLALGVLVGFVMPTILLVVISTIAAGATGVALYVVSVAYLTTCALMLIEANLAFRKNLRPPPPAASDGWTPEVTLLVVAYLPNEAGLVRQTLEHLCREVDLPGVQPQVLLAYNTPTPMPIEQELQQLAHEIPALDVIRVDGSTSKAENVMGVLPFVRGEVVAILDTDHHLHREAAHLALRWFDGGYDIVQGRCVVRNARHNLLTRIVSFEFETIYGIAHAGRSLLVDTGIFGGANGWWRTSVLREIGLDHRMLTEDIDASLRALMAGHRIVHDRDVISTELAPVTLPAWWRQRTRWAQGWFQVTLRHARDMRHTPVLPLPTRIYWGMMLTWREMFPLISLQVASIVAADTILGRGLHLKTDPFLIFTTTVTFVSGALVGAAAWRVATRETRDQLSVVWAVVGCILILPYTLLRNAVAIAAIVRELVGDRRWMVTRRTMSGSAASKLARTEST